MTYAQERNAIFDFIKNSLPTRLRTDQKNYRIVSEGDLQSCTYYHLRKFLKPNKFPEWYILNKLSMGGRKSSKKFPDIVIAWMANKPQGNYAAILIELKETITFRDEVALDELEKLETLIKLQKSEYGFLLYACRDTRPDKKEKHTDKIMERKIPKRWKKRLIAKTINIKGAKNYPADLDRFDEKVEILRKYRG